MIANTITNHAQTMSPTQRHYEARGRVQRLRIRYGRSCHLVDADQFRLLLRWRMIFVHDTSSTRYRIKGRRVLFLFISFVLLFYFETSDA